MDALKRQADADAIRHAAKMIEVVTIEAQTDEGRMVRFDFETRRDDVASWLNTQADNMEGITK